MRLIGITGPSGSGKSTLSRDLKEKIPNSDIIYIDFNMIGSYFTLRDKMIEIYGEDIFLTKDIPDNLFIDGEYDTSLFKYFNEPLFLSDIEKVKEAWKYAIPIITEKTRQDILRRSNSDVIILDSPILPLSKLFGECDIRILINADSNTRYTVLADREEFACSKETAQRRDQVIGFDYSDYEYTLKFSNDYTLETLHENANKVEGVLNPNKIFVLMGDSGSGKTFFINNVASRYANMSVIQRQSSRKVRDGEENSIEIKAGLFEKDVKKLDYVYSIDKDLKGFFKKATYTGFSKDDIDKAFAQKHSSIVIADTDTYQRLKLDYPGRVVPIYISRNYSSEEEFEQALKKGGRSPEEIELRKKLSKIAYEELYIRNADDIGTDRIVDNHIGTNPEELQIQFENIARQNYIDLGEYVSEKRKGLSHIKAVDFKHSDCKLCSIIENKANCTPENVIIYEDDKFVVTPVKGSIVEGYLMVTPKRHIESLADLSEDEFEQLLFVNNQMSDMLKQIYGKSTILFERGSGKGNEDLHPGAITHAHMHIIPTELNKEIHSEILEEADMMQLVEPKTILENSIDTYLLYIDNNGNWFKTKSPETFIPPQYVRRKVAINEGIPDLWNWREHSLDKNAIKTLEDVVTYLKNHKLSPTMKICTKGFLDRMDPKESSRRPVSSLQITD